MNDEGVVDYQNESPNKKLNIHSLVEAIVEQSNRQSSHDWEYLSLRIKLLCEFFGIPSKDDWPNELDLLINGCGKLPSVEILPLEGALEVPSGVIFESLDTVLGTYENEIHSIRAQIRKIQSEYVTLVLMAIVPEEKIQNQLRLSDLINAGLPVSDPGIDYELY